MEAILSDLLLRLSGLGPWAYAAAPLLMAVVAILPIPAEAPAMMNGILFGPWLGTAITWTGAMLGAVASFEMARALGRPVAERLVSAETLARADRVALGAGWSGLLVARFVPLVAFTAVNWGAGLTPLPRWTFVWTTGVGILPGAIVFTASGAGVSLLMGRHPVLVGAVATVVLAVLLLRAFRPAPEVQPAGEAGAPEDGT